MCEVVAGRRHVHGLHNLFPDQTKTARGLKRTPGKHLVRSCNGCMDPPGRIELPNAFEHADIDHLVILIADMLERLMEHNDRIPLSPESLTRFHSRTPPSITVLDYLRRIVRYANVERTCLLITLHYIDQICARLPHFTLSSLTCHRFVITATVVASKALCDSFCTNAHYAKVGGLRTGELNMLERELLCAIDWRLTTTREVLDAYYINLVRTNSSGTYTIAAPPAPEHGISPEVPSGDADSDMDSVRSTSPVQPLINNISVRNMPAESDAVAVAGAPATMSRDVSFHIHGTNEFNTRARNEGSGLVGQAVPTRARTASSAGTDAAIAASATTTPRVYGPSTVLRERATLSPRICAGPTFEQNMAFAALREPGSGTSMSAPTSASTSTPVGVADALSAGHGSVVPVSAVTVGYDVLSSSAPPPSNGTSPIDSANAMRVSESPVSGLSMKLKIDEDQIGSIRNRMSPLTVRTPEEERASHVQVLSEAGLLMDSHDLDSAVAIVSESINYTPPSDVPSLPTPESLDSGRELMYKRVVEDTLSEAEDPERTSDLHYRSPRPRTRPRTRP